MKTSRILTIGSGEVGRALAEVLDCWLEDIHDMPTVDAEQIMVLMIAFPYGPDFVAEVRRYQALYPDAFVCVNSTVKPGTCAENGWNFSPVTGRHPHLAPSMRTMSKPVAGPHAFMLAHIFREAGVPTTVYRGTVSELEASKLTDLLVYGANIRIAKEVHAYCAAHGLDYDLVFNESARRYNASYADDPRFRRYQIDHQPGPIGGHCVSYPNLALWENERIEDLVRPATAEHWTGDLE